MNEMKDAPAHIEEVKFKRMKGPGADGDVKDLFARLALRFYVKDKTAPKWLETLVPGIDTVLKSIAANEEHPGVTMTTRLAVPDQRFTIRRADGAAVVELLKAKVTTKPSIKVDKDGEVEVLVAVVCRLPDDMLGKIQAYCDGADVVISTSPQTEAFDDTTVKEAPKKEKGTRTRKNGVATPHLDAPQDHA